MDRLMRRVNRSGCRCMEVSPYTRVQMLQRVAAIAVISALSTTARADPLETASRLYDNKEYEAASGELFALLTDDSRSPDDVTKQRAEMMMARTLVALNYPIVAVAFFHKLADGMRSNPLRNSALKYIVIA